MKEFNYKEWLESLNEDERSMVEWLEYARLSVEENPNYERPIKEEHIDEDWAVYPFILRDRENAWDPVYIGTAQNVFEAHESIVNEFLDTLYDRAFERQLYGEFSLPNHILPDGEKFYLEPLSAEYWAYIGDHKEDYPDMSDFIAGHTWELKMCKLIVYGYKNVDLNKFV